MLIFLIIIFIKVNIVMSFLLRYRARPSVTVTHRYGHLLIVLRKTVPVVDDHDPKHTSNSTKWFILRKYIYHFTTQPESPVKKFTLK